MEAAGHQGPGERLRGPGEDAVHNSICSLLKHSAVDRGTFSTLESGVSLVSVGEAAQRLFTSYFEIQLPFYSILVLRMKVGGI